MALSIKHGYDGAAAGRTVADGTTARHPARPHHSRITLRNIPATTTVAAVSHRVTAVLLRLVLDVVIAIKTPLKGYRKQAPSIRMRVGAAIGLWLLLVGSKFAVLEIVDLVFGDRVRLGGFWLAAALILG